jgi:hypothetical protein
VGFHPYGAPEVYYYTARPYRRDEGGEGNAKLLTVDIGSTIDLKCLAIELLPTYNRLQAAQTRLAVGKRPGVARSCQPARRSDRQKSGALLRRRARGNEEFNHVNMRAGDGLPPHIREHSVPK